MPIPPKMIQYNNAYFLCCRQCIHSVILIKLVNTYIYIYINMFITILFTIMYILYLIIISALLVPNINQYNIDNTITVIFFHIAYIGQIIIIL